MGRADQFDPSELPVITMHLHFSVILALTIGALQYAEPKPNYYPSYYPSYYGGQQPYYPPNPQNFHPRTNPFNPHQIPNVFMYNYSPNTPQLPINYQQQSSRPQDVNSNYPFYGQEVFNNFNNPNSPNNPNNQNNLNYPTDDAEIVDEEDLPNYLARIQGTAANSEQQLPRTSRMQPETSNIPLEASIMKLPDSQRTNVRQFTYPTQVSSNSYVEEAPKTITVIRNFPGDGSKPKVEVISDFSTMQTPSGTIVVNDKTAESNGSVEVEEDDEDEDREDEDEGDENDIKAEIKSSEDESHPQPITSWSNFLGGK